MLISPTWLREFVEIPVDDRRLADDLTLAGISIEGVFGEGARTLFDADITTNRVDAMNHFGVARECSAIYDRELKAISPALTADPAEGGATPKEFPFSIFQFPEGSRATEGGGTAPAFRVEIEDPQGCARYTARVVRGVKIRPSPDWMASRLELLESRPINNAADATNYTLQEMGHPTHAFDLDLLEGGKIVVRRARAGERLKTLDGVERNLSEEDLVIADARKAVALAGVMGGFDTMITEKTRNVLIESAWFDPPTIRKTARRHGMHSDASHRFERGADFGATPLACARVAELILKTAGGTLEGGALDVIGRQIERPWITLNRAEVRRLLGQDVPEREISRILRRLGFRLRTGNTTTVAVSESIALGVGGAHAAVAEQFADFIVQPPLWRLDVEREVDLIEEIARIYGFDHFPNTLPSFAGAVREAPEERKEAKLRSLLLALGYDEALSPSFVPPAVAAEFSGAEAVVIANPINEEASVMRTSLLPGMLDMLEWNLNRGVTSVRLSEAANIYERMGGGAEEHKRIALGATGMAAPASVHQTARPCTLFDLKGDIETLLNAFDYRTLYFDAHPATYFQPGRSGRAVMDGVTVARFGQLHAEGAERRKLRQEVYIAEIYLERVYQHALRVPAYKPIPRFPAVERDFSFIFEDRILFQRIQGAVQRLQIAELRGFSPVEIFRGSAIGTGKYSLLLRATFQSPERTLRDEEVAVWAQQIIQALEGLGGVQRAGRDR